MKSKSKRKKSKKKDQGKEMPWPRFSILAPAVWR